VIKYSLIKTFENRIRRNKRLYYREGLFGERTCIILLRYRRFEFLSKIMSAPLYGEIGWNRGSCLSRLSSLWIYFNRGKSLFCRDFLPLYLQIFLCRARRPRRAADINQYKIIFAACRGRHALQNINNLRQKQLNFRRVYYHEQN